MKRRRNVYDLHLEQLLVDPGQPRPAEEMDLDELDSAVASDSVTNSDRAGPEEQEVPSPGAEDGLAVEAKPRQRVIKGPPLRG